MYFPWYKYEEVYLDRRNTLQIFVTNRCNLKCEGCFARNSMVDNLDISLKEYRSAVDTFVSRHGGQINILGGEPLVHPRILDLIDYNFSRKLKTTIYTNGSLLHKFTTENFIGAKLRVSVHSESGLKAISSIKTKTIPFEANFMVGSDTTLREILSVAKISEKEYGCKVFFISSYRELDNPNKEFFDDTRLTMPVLDYKKLVHEFLLEYRGNMDIHISKRGVFESTKTQPDCRCRFANYFIGGKIIQCPYDVVNLEYQVDYTFGERFCQKNNTCLMSKIKLRRKINA